MLYPNLLNSIQEITSLNIPEERKTILKPLTDYIQKKVDNNQELRLIFICTHNSRRSHLSQIWAQTMAYYFNINNVFCYSGGTEVTAVYPMVAETLQHSGFTVVKLSESSNPVYAFKFAENEHPVIAFSKKFDDDFNPKSEFAAIMTCDSANEACPIVPGTEARIPITYEDPKIYDNTEQQTKMYKQRSLQIASEMYYVFNQIKK